MSINFIPNDPFAGPQAPPVRKKKPRTNRPAGRATFQFFDQEPEGLAQPGSTQFLFWQAREAALTTLAAWETVNGKFAAWQGARRTVPFVQNAVAQLQAKPDLNAFYNRASFQFFEGTAGGKTTFSGESTDVVAHEVGHGLLDSLRPDLIESALLEVGAFHEAFGDCVALMTALLDVKSRTAVRPTLAAQNFLETTAEDLSEAVRRMQPNHNAAQPRHGRNTLQWQLPSTLPTNGGPGALINEEHSFGRIFSGSFYDLIVLLAGAAPSAVAIRRATIKAGQLLVAGVRTAPLGARFFQAVGRAMVLADETDSNGANRELIKQAFAGHGVQLGTSAMLAPVLALAGAGPVVKAKGATVSAAGQRHLLSLMGDPRAKLSMTSLLIGEARVAQTRVEREVSLGQVHPSLKGCIVKVSDTVLLGASGKRAAVLGALPQLSSTEDEVLSFVSSLVAHHRILTRPAPAKQRRRSSGELDLEPMSPETHILVRGGKHKELRRRAFACHCC